MSDLSSKLPWEITLLDANDGYQNLISTIIVCTTLHISLTLVILPFLVTFLTNNLYSFRTLNKLTIKIISAVFDLIAVTGAIKELIAPQADLLSDPLYGFSSHSQFHFSVAAGFFFWAAAVTLLFSVNLTLALPTLFHHVLCCLIYTITLKPFLHHTGNVFLFFQASTLVIDLHSISRIVGTPRSGFNRTLRFIHPFVFFLSRILVGVPLSFSFIKSMVYLLWTGDGHSKAEITFMLLTNIFLNGFNLFWLFEHVTNDGISSTPCATCTGVVTRSARKKQQEQEQGRGRTLHPHSATPSSPARRSGSKNFFETTSEYPSSKKPSAQQLKTPTATLKYLRLFLSIFVLLSAASIYKYSNFILEPPSTAAYSSIIDGDDFRHKSKAASLRRDKLVDALIEDAGGVALLSQSIRENLNIAADPPVLDIVVSGGGFRGQYAGGVLGVLAALEAKNVLTLERWAGASIGACTGASFAVGVPFEDFFRVPYAWQGVWKMNEFWKGGHVVREMMERTLADLDDWRSMNNKVFVSVTQFDGLWPKNNLVSEFTSKEDLINAFVASASIPFFTAYPIWGTFRGGVALDGGLTLNTPVFSDKLNAQLVINLGYAKYPLKYTFQPRDSSHEGIVYDGMDDIVTLLRGEGRPLAVELISGIADVESKEECEGGEEGAEVEWETHPFLDGLLHFLRFDFFPWFFGGGFGFPSFVMAIGAGFVFWTIGVYHDVVE